MSNLTPIQFTDGIWFKRDDLFTAFGLNGAKVRGAIHLIEKAYKTGCTRFTTAGSRNSMQLYIVGKLCEKYGFDFVAHTPSGDLPESFKNFNIIQHRAGYNNVLEARCREFAKEKEYCEIPFGLAHIEVMQLTMRQAFNLPNGIKRIVMPVGGGVNLIGVLMALQKQKIRVPVIGVVVGKSPVKLLNTYAPYGWQSKVELVNAEVPYQTPIKHNEFHGIALDEIYEAKCIPFVKKGDLLWIVGKRNF